MDISKRHGDDLKCIICNCDTSKKVGRFDAYDSAVASNSTLFQQ